MSYDFEDLPEGYVPSPVVVAATPPMQANDLELIVLCLELGALMLTNKPGDVFTYEQLVEKAHEMGDSPGVVFDDLDAKIIVGAGTGFLKKVRGGYVLR